MDKVYDMLSVEEIHQLIRDGVVSITDVIDYYNNEWWDEIP